jgi:membrane protein YqaA with SNARE-associated domain
MFARLQELVSPLRWLGTYAGALQKQQQQVVRENALSQMKEHQHATYIRSWIVISFLGVLGGSFCGAVGG